MQVILEKNKEKASRMVATKRAFIQKLIDRAEMMDRCILVSSTEALSTQLSHGTFLPQVSITTLADELDHHNPLNLHNEVEQFLNNPWIPDDAKHAVRQTYTEVYSE